MLGVEWRRVFPRSVMLLCLLALGVQAVLLIVLATTGEEGVPHRAPVAVVTAPVVAQALADQANAMEDEPFAAEVASDSEEARDGLRQGAVVAVLEVDLRGTRDRLVLNDANGDRLNDAVRQRIEAVETSYQRTVEVHRIDTSAGEPGLPRWLTLVANVVGFLFVVLVSVWRGPVARTFGRALVRHLGLAATSVVTAAVLTWTPVGPDDPSVQAWAIIALSMMVAGSVTLALEAVAGLAGLAVAVTLFVLQAAPLLLRTDAHLLPWPWPDVLPFTPLGAMDEAVAGAVSFDDSGALGRPVLVLMGWLLIAWLTSLASRRVQATAAPAARSRRTQVAWRIRVAAVVLPATALMVTATLVLPHDAVPGPEELPSRASETECVHTGPVRGIADLNRIAKRLRGGDEFQGGDVGASVQLQDGRTLMVFGDTLRSPGYDGQRFVRNSMLVMEQDCLQMVSPADHGALIPDRVGKTSGAGAGTPVGYWPMSIGREARPGYDLVAVTAQRVRSSGEGQGAFDFENLGPAIAVFVVPRGGTPQLVALRDIGEDDADPNRPTWGAAAAVSDGWAYLYGTSNPQQDLVFGYSLSVARVRPDEILDESKWRFWDGQGWARDAGRAAELIPAQGGTSQTLSVFEQDGTWYALSKRDEFLGSDLTVWTAPGPQGPFTAHGALAELPSDTVRGELRYMPLAHPGLLPEPGTMVVSYSRNRTDVDQIIKNPLAYRPRFLRVELP